MTKVVSQTGENESKKLAKVVSTNKDGKEHKYFADHQTLNKRKLMESFEITVEEV